MTLTKQINIVNSMKKTNYFHVFDTKLNFTTLYHL